MSRTDIHTKKTGGTLQQLVSNGVTRMAVLMRHSVKSLSAGPGEEPFMPLTRRGQQAAFKMGQSLPDTMRPQFFSSTFGRCVETAYLMDKGFTAAHGVSLTHHLRVSKRLTPFYVNNIQQVAQTATELGNSAFITRWFEKKWPSDLILDPVVTAGTQIRYLLGRLDRLDENEIAICVSHDWNLFPVKHFFMDLPFENYPDAGYLEGIICFENAGRFYLAGHQTRPVLLEPDTIDHISITDFDLADDGH